MKTSQHTSQIGSATLSIIIYFPFTTKPARDATVCFGVKKMVHFVNIPLFKKMNYTAHTSCRISLQIRTNIRVQKQDKKKQKFF